MSRVTEEEREALRLAAVAAVPILAKLEKEAADLSRRIQIYRATIAEYEAALGKRQKNPTARPDGAKKAQRGQVVEHIDAVLSSGVALGEPELRKQVNERFATAYTRTSIYSALRRGLGVKYEVRPDTNAWKKKTEVRLVAS